MKKPEYSEVEVAVVGNKSRLITCKSVSPLKLLSPDCATTAHVVLSGYGGGMLAGDVVRLKLKLHPDSKLLISTQSNSRVFKSENGQKAVQSIEGNLEKNAFAVSFPDPLIPHAQSRIRQDQKWQLGERAVLLSIDWFASGRSESGESFLFTEYESGIEIYKEGKLFFNDLFAFSNNGNQARNKASFGDYNYFINGYLAGDETTEKFRKLKDLLLSLNPSSESARENFALGQNDFIYAADQVKEGLIAFRVLSKRRLDMDSFVKKLARTLSSNKLLGVDFCERKF